MCVYECVAYVPVLLSSKHNSHDNSVYYAVHHINDNACVNSSACVCVCILMCMLTNMCIRMSMFMYMCVRAFISAHAV